MNNKELYTTIVGLKNYEGNKVFKIGSIVRLVKEPDNDYDLEAIACENKYIGKTGYIANSTQTVTKGTMSAGRIYDKIGDISYCEVKFVSNDSVIAKVLSDDKIQELKKDNEDDTFFNSEL
ncbi:HIRAN domain-containing protein [Methanobrevibacter sp. V74]|uniref:HIRAN domain-containing protein n=1 Tax=Methanobrevibacter sp. V74 TaxID=3064279 RepID=UPI0027352033|nr:HIRAN domain-containing protein [Methanobrevibacter sp. V74]